MERVPGQRHGVPVRYDAASGKRTVAERGGRERPRGFDGRSPDGRKMLFHERGNLHVRDLEGGRTTQLTRSRPGESVSNGQPMWSPDGKRVAFVQSDHSKIRLRSVLVPGDPDGSLFFRKIAERLPPVGEQMPLQQPPLLKLPQHNQQVRLVQHQ